MDNKIHISIVSPVYKAEKIVPELVKRIEDSVSKITPNYEIILVEDCGLDNSWEMIKTICQINQKVKGIHFSRNFGQHYAIAAGLDFAAGEWIVVMDCDLQDKPEEIGKLYNKAIEGYDMVLAKRIQRQHSFIKRMGSNIFYKFLGYMTETEQDSSIANFGIYNNKVIKSVNQLREQIKFFPASVQWVGYKRTSIEIQHAERFEGESSYNFKRLWRLGFNTIIAFSEKPLKLVVKLGVIIAILSVVSALILVVLALNHKFTVIGWSSLIISICFFSGLIIFILGIIGLYLSRVFNEVKGRPLYIINEQKNIVN
jgi:dolichol-phosphate mannosyltransferase